MRTKTVTLREGESMGPVDWTHETARDMPPIWREAEKAPGDYLLNDRWSIIEISMYDGWPYWAPRPAIYFIGPLNCGEWTFFDSYGVHTDSITRRKQT